MYRGERREKAESGKLRERYGGLVGVGERG